MPSQKYLDDMRNLIGLQSGGNVPFNWEWVGRTPYLFPLQNMVLWGMGLPLGIAACGAFLWASWRLFWRRDATNLLLLAWIASYFLFWGRQFNLTARYFLPLYPALVLLAAQALDEMWRLAGSATLHAFLQRRFAQLRPAAPIILKGAVVGVTAGTVLWALAFTNVYRRPLTRVEASAWMLEQPARAIRRHARDVGRRTAVQRPGPAREGHRRLQNPSRMRAVAGRTGARPLRARHRAVRLRPFRPEFDAAGRPQPRRLHRAQQQPPLRVDSAGAGQVAHDQQVLRAPSRRQAPGLPPAEDVHLISDPLRHQHQRRRRRGQLHRLRPPEGAALREDAGLLAGTPDDRTSERASARSRRSRSWRPRTPTRMRSSFAPTTA